jgi:predicted DNA-binding transcriptional regulator YafY
MADAIYRQWVLLRKIPRQSTKLSTRALWERLRGEGFEVTKRTVERDLLALSATGLFGFTAEEQGGTTYWFWPDGAAAIDIPGLDPATALALVLAREHLEPLLPAATLDLLAPYFKRGEQVLDADAGHKLGAWRRKVRTVSRGPQLAKPKILPAVNAAVTEALLHERRLRARYRRRDSEVAEERELHPLGLVAKDGVLYLVATAKDHVNPYQFALHRFESAEVLQHQAKKVVGFTQDRYVDEQAAFSYPGTRKTINLVADFTRDAVAHLRERPLSSDQTLIEQPDGHILLTATILPRSANRQALAQSLPQARLSWVAALSIDWRQDNEPLRRLLSHRPSDPHRLYWFPGGG